MAENIILIPSSSSSSDSASAEGTLPPSSSYASAHQNQISITFYPQQKPRLKWTPQLHARFLEAVQFLGGVQRATPKANFEFMNEKDLTIQQIRNHLQVHRTHCLDQEQLGRETQAVVVAQLAWVAAFPYPQPYGYPLYSAPPTPLYSPLRPQLPSPPPPLLPPQHLLPPPPPPAAVYFDPAGPMSPSIPPSLRMMDYTAPAPKTIVFKKLFPEGRPVPETPELMMSGDVNPAGPSSSAARNVGEDDGPLDLTLSIRPPSRR